MECRFCKRSGFREFTPLESLSEEDRKPYLVCDECYYGQRLDAENWLKWLREKCNQDAIRRIGCLFIPGKGIACGDPYIPADEYDPELEKLRLENIVSWADQELEKRKKKNAIK